MSALNHPRWVKLSDKRQEELLDEYRDVNVHHDWWDCTFDDFVEKCDAVGLDVAASDIQFSGFWSQGDGASFEGQCYDWARFLTALNEEAYIPAAQEGWTFNTYTRGWYRWMEGSLNWHEPDNPYDEEDEPLQHDAWELQQPSFDEKVMGALEDSMAELCRDLANDLYKALEEEYDYLTEDEQVVDWILENLDDDELRDPDEEEEDEGDVQVDHSKQLSLI